MLDCVLALGFLCFQAQLPVLHEESILASGEPNSRIFGTTLHLAGERLAVIGHGESLEEVHVLRREGRTWVGELDLVNHDLPSSWDGSDFDGNRLLLSSGENAFSLGYRRVGDGWQPEQFFSQARFARFHGNRLATTRLFGSAEQHPALTLWKETATGWIFDADVLPGAPQASASCCGPLDLWGNTVVFAAHDAAGRPSLEVHVRAGGTWRKEAELLPASGGVEVSDLRLWGDTLAALVLERSEAPGATAFVFERGQGAWSEVARLFPERVTSLALDQDTLVLGQAFDDTSAGAAFVVERDRDRWTPTHELRASDGWNLGLAVAQERRTVAVSSFLDPARPGRIYLFRLPPLARVNSYGCGVNPAGSLVVLAGRPSVGGALTLGVDDPSGAMPAGALVYLGVSRRPDPKHPCGTLVPGAGLGGGPGEFLLRLDPGFPLWTSLAGTLPRPGPLEVPLAIPASPTLIGHTLYVQAALLDPAPGRRAAWGLTTALELTIGR